MLARVRWGTLTDIGKTNNLELLVGGHCGRGGAGASPRETNAKGSSVSKKTQTVDKVEEGTVLGMTCSSSRRTPNPI